MSTTGKMHWRVVDYLRCRNVLVQSLHEHGDGVPDLLVGYRGVICLLEVKGSSSSLTLPQQAFHRRWAGYPVLVVRDPFQAWAAVRRFCGEVKPGPPMEPALTVYVPWGKGTTLTKRQLAGGPVLAVPVGETTETGNEGEQDK